MVDKRPRTINNVRCLEISNHNKIQISQNFYSELQTYNNYARMVSMLMGHDDLDLELLSNGQRQATDAKRSTRPGLGAGCLELNVVHIDSEPFCWRLEPHKDYVADDLRPTRRV